ncbi:bacillithiol transferase BstA [Leptobacterium flavescens]|uniref:Bacillithiol transferase BstA n=1 Tax=Leptobacterium flavescens TaxID=472055 RepID=A0A6P0URB9_9FLAO|nr:bacillithiol transferase BstA [Leptobacterium flavescens]NER15467.1 bacillithiol transferase BstA [Leptobacterium flavescens]
MTEKELEKLRYPTGKFQCPEEITSEDLDRWTKVLEELPAKLENLVEGLTDEQLATPYRPGGWTIRQVVHHIADSHHNSYTRFKWALTEENPLIKVYQEKNWADLIDAKNAPIRMSLDYLRVLHAKLVYLIRRLTSDQLKRTFIHPEDNSEVSLAENIGKYAWHGNHHYTHIKNALERM